MYKIIRDEFSNSENTIHKISSNTFITAFSGSAGWEQFVDDIYTNGLGIVEGADYVGVTTYTDARAEEYPPIKDQLDKIYHSGIDAWKTDIKAIKDKYPKQTMDTEELKKRKDAVIFNLQKRDYEKAIARIAQYELSTGVKDENGNYIIEPLPLIVGNERNSLVVQDEQERIAALQIIIDTPQAVIDSINT